MTQASARAMQSRYAIQICGSGIPSMNKHLLVYPCELSATGEPAGKQVPYLKIKKKANECRTTLSGVSSKRNIRMYLVKEVSLSLFKTFLIFLPYRPKTT